MLPLNGFSIPWIKRRVALLLALALTGLSLIACLGGPIPAAAAIATQQAYSLAQATLDQGRNDLDALSHQATVVSQEMAQAAATQKNILQQTQFASTAEAVALDQAATEQSQSAAATLTAYNVSVTQTAQAQVEQTVQAEQTAQAIATQTAFSLTATPWAALQVDLARAKAEAAQAARWQDYVVTPVKVSLWFVAGLILVFIAVLAYRWIFDALDLDNRPITLQALRPLRKPRLPRDETAQVEIVGPSEPSVVNWIAEAEKKLRIRP
jgi:hypothetical protein